MPSTPARYTVLPLLALSLLPLWTDHVHSAPSAAAVAQYRAQRAQAAHRTRRLIFNNDGDDHLTSGEATVEAFLAQRTTPLIGSQVDTIFYCTSRPFGVFTHNTKVGDVLTMKGCFARDRNNIVSDLIGQGTDPLKTMVEWCHGHGVEVFWSMRMNDTHDAYHAPDAPQYYWSTFKDTHPQFLFGTRAKRPEYGSWSAVDFAEPEVRDFLFRVFEEICTGYDVEGIELDFFRHLVLFRTVAEGGHATPEEREMLTDLLRRVRAMTETEGMRRGRPLLISIRAPDSVEYCRGMGIDLETWMADDLIDLFVAGGDFRLNPWEVSTALGEKNGIPVYCDLDPSIPYGLRTPFDRNSLEAYRGRALNAWHAGAAGIYVFNCFNPRHPLWSELGDAEALRRKDRLYFVNVTGRSGYLHPGRSLRGGDEYTTLPSLHPLAPVRLEPGKPIAVPLRVGEDLGDARTEDLQPTATCHVFASVPDAPTVKLNGEALQCASAKGNLFVYGVGPELVRAGENSVAVSVDARPAEPDQWDVEHTCSENPPAPWIGGRGRPGTSATMQDGALLIADRGTEPGSYFYNSYPWGVDPAVGAVVEAEAKVVSGRSTIIVANGATEEEVRLYPDRVVARDAGLAYAMDTTDAFHVYRVEIKGQDLKVFVDDALRIDAAGKFVLPASSGRNTLSFGAGSSPEKGEAYWKSVRLRSGARFLYDVVLSVEYPAADAGK